MTQEFRYKTGTWTTYEKVNQTLDPDQEQESLDDMYHRIGPMLFKYLLRVSHGWDWSRKSNQQAYIGLSYKIQKAAEKGNQADVSLSLQRIP